MRFHSYFNTAVALIKIYKGDIPLNLFLKKYFSENKKHGSKDRKFISHLCYCYYRLGHSTENISEEERLKIALFLCNEKVAEWHVLFDGNWINSWSEKLEDRIDFIKKNFSSFSEKNIFPYQNKLSENLAAAAFGLSHLIQPKLFIRVRNSNNSEAVIKRLGEKNILFDQLSETCFSFANATKLDEVLNINKDVVIQDISSQRIAKFMQPPLMNIQPLTVWDCCAASGGKSILAKDIFENFLLTVSDIRLSIIENLKLRFEQAGIKNYKAFVADISTPPRASQFLPFDLIICDAPCTGSGTWARTPEQLYFFHPNKILHYASLQKKIIANAITFLSDEGYFLYITCSVFKQENEDIIKYIQEKFSVKLVRQSLLKGFEKQADTMFAALFQKQKVIKELLEFAG